MSEEKLQEGKDERKIRSDISEEKLQEGENGRQIRSDISEAKSEHEHEGDVHNNEVGHTVVKHSIWRQHNIPEASFFCTKVF